MTYDLKEAVGLHLRRGVVGGFWGIELDELPDEVLVRVTIGFDGREEKQYNLTSTNGLNTDHAVVNFIIINSSRIKG